MLIAQISDTHIKPAGRKVYGVVDTERFLSDAVAHLLRLDPAPDIVLATGDLVDGGSAEEYVRLRALLAPIPWPLYVIPGNHDERAALRAAFADHDYLPKDGGFLHYAVDGHPVRLVALDTVVPGEGGGLMCAERCAWLDGQLGKAAQRPTLVLMHHPPFLTGIAHMDRVKLDGADTFGEVIRRHPQVERVVCGHVHRSMQLKWRGTLVSICPSTAHQVTLDLRAGDRAEFALEPPGFQLHHWRPRIGMVTHTVNVGVFEGPYSFKMKG
jgi:3',5'-cyclic AMP phosphodiesterase CpdA